MKHFDLSLQQVGGHTIGVVAFDLKNEKVNKFNKEVMEDFKELIGVLKNRAKEFEALVVVSPKPGNFIAGADITLIQSAKNEAEATELARTGQNLLNEWEDLPFPKVVAINGACMGGGCELSLASNAIVMSNDPSARIGLPEVLLGFIPGMGGCIRMPWKVGIAQAFDLILSGKTLTGEKAVKAGLAEACLPKENFNENALTWVVNHLFRLKSGDRIAKEPKLGGMGGTAGNLLESFGKSIIFKKAHEGVMEKTKGQYPAALEVIDVIRETGTHYQANFRGAKRDSAMTREAKGFGSMSVTDVSKNCVRLFFLTEGIKKANGLIDGKTAETKKILQAGVLGAGVMGGGIAHLFADKGITVRMKDIQNTALEIGVQSALTLFKKAVKRKSITPRQMQQKLNRIAPTTTYEGFKVCEVVVEAVVEKIEIKQSVLKDLENHVSDDCVIATNTSSLSVSKMQSVMKHPERFAGMHFFNPVHKMPLIEVIRGEKSSDQAVSQVFQLSKQIGKMPIVVKDSPGFLVNRLLMPYLTEAGNMLAEGATIEELDSAMLEFGMPMGPIELMDEVGLDVGDKVGHILNDAFGERMKQSNSLAPLLNLKRLGKKSGSGFYVYSGKDKKDKTLEPNIYEILGIKTQPGKILKQEIIDRCVLCMVNEAARCLEEKVVETPADVDLGMIMGTGFPPFRGGLMRYADNRGLKEIIQTLEALEKKYGMRFKPATSLVNTAQTKGSFYA